jgi:crossover junction endodeoxyribonuclease RuvC
MLILGVDPGSLVTGYGVIDASGATFRRLTSGVIVMRSSDAMPLRLRTVYDALLTLIDTWHPDEFCIETAFYGKNVQSTLKLGHIRGVALLAAVHRELAIAEYSPREVKRAVTGSGAAAKQQVEYMIKVLLNIKDDFRRSDEADGLALAMCHAMHLRTPRSGGNTWKNFIKEHPDRVKR